MEFYGRRQQHHSAGSPGDHLLLKHPQAQDPSQAGGAEECQPYHHSQYVFSGNLKVWAIEPLK